MSQPRRRRDNLIYALSGTAWPYCLSMSAALPENMRGSDMVLVLLLFFFLAARRENCFRARGMTGRVLGGVVVVRVCLTRRRCSDALEAARGK